MLRLDVRPRFALKQLKHDLVMKPRQPIFQWDSDVPNHTTRGMMWHQTKLCRLECHPCPPSQSLILSPKVTHLCPCLSMHHHCPSSGHHLLPFRPPRWTLSPGLLYSICSVHCSRSNLYCTFQAEGTVRAKARGKKDLDLCQNNSKVSVTSDREREKQK